MHPSLQGPVTQSVVRDLDVTGTIMNRPFISTQQRSVTLFAAQAELVPQISYRTLVESVGAARSRKSFDIENFGCLFCRGSGLPKRDNPTLELSEVAQLFVTANRPDELDTALVTTHPMDRRFCVFAVTFTVHHDPLDQAANHRLAIGMSRFRRTPQCRNIGGERSNARLILWAQSCNRLSTEAIKFILDRTLGTECFFPISLQCRGDQSILGIDCAIATLD